ncbi:MAG: hypothetical protein ABJA71_10070 [Ginsengibacter sp.]
MKRFISRSKIIAMAFALTFSLGSVENFAQDTNNKSDNPVELTYIGNVNNQPQFQLKLNNNEAGEFVITIKDLSGNVLYSEVATGKLFSRKYLLNIDEMGVSEIRFEVSSKKSNSKTVYAVSTTSRVVEDVAVNKL